MPMRFLCDEMLMRLARLLRAAGYDVYLASDGQPDAEILRIAQAENRILVTRDKRLAERAHPRGITVEGRGAMAEAQSLAARIPVDWRIAPFTRCVVDNAPLAPAAPQEVERMPPETRAMPGPFRVCPVCRRLYWPGSHVKRIAERLATLAQLAPQAPL